MNSACKYMFKLNYKDIGIMDGFSLKLKKKIRNQF